MRREGRMKTLVISCYLYSCLTVILTIVSFATANERMLHLACILMGLTGLTYVLATCYVEDGVEITRMISIASFLTILPILLPSAIIIYGYNIFVRVAFNARGGDEEDEY